MLSTISRSANMPAPFEVGRREFRRSFDGNGNARQTRSRYAPLSIRDDGRHILLEFDVPGVKPDRLNLILENHQLRVQVRRDRPQHDAARRYDERCYGGFERIVALDDTIDSDSVDATLEAGVLSVRLSRKPHSRPHRVQVKYPPGAEPL